MIIFKMKIIILILMKMKYFNKKYILIKKKINYNPKK